MSLSIIILSKNDISGLEKTLRSVTNVSEDIIVYDYGISSGSNEIALQYRVSFTQGKADSYERMRYKASQLARNDWILMLHTGEVVDPELNISLRRLDFNLKKKVYRIKFKKFYDSRWLSHGEWGGYSEIRIASREGVPINGESIQEEIFQQPGLVIKTINGFILQHTVTNACDFVQKIINDAMLWAVKSHRHGRKANIFNILFSPTVDFIKNYFFKMGVLDGHEGYVCAKMEALFTFLKYARLRDLNKTIKN